MATPDSKIDFLGLDHIALGCSDMARTVAFYHGILGMPILHTLEYTGKDEDGNEVPMGQHFFFGVGGENPNAHLAFFYWKNGYHVDAGNMPPQPLPPEVNPRARSFKPGVVGHINLRVDQKRIPEFCKLLGDAGIEYRHTTRYGDPWHEVTTVNGYAEPKDGCLMDSVYFDDPDGLHLEFNAWLPLWDAWPNDAEPWADPRTPNPQMTTAATEPSQPQPKGRTKMPPRLRQPRRSEIASEEIHHRFDQLFGDKDPAVEPGTKEGTPGTWWTTMANEPGVFHLIEERHKWQYSAERALSPLHRELALTRTGWARGSQLVYSQHRKVLRRLGVEEVKIDSLTNWSSTDCFTQQERVLLGYVDDLVLGGGRVSDERFTQLRSVFSDVEILELTYVTCTYIMSATMSLALRLEFDDRPDPVVEVTSGSGPSFE